MNKTAENFFILEQACPQCGFSMLGIAGLKDARCKNCGYKESCCY